MRLCALTLVGAWSLALLASCAHHSPVRDSSGGKMPLEIQRTLEVRLNGTQQRIYEAGSSSGNPVLLWLDGGPGGSEVAWVRRYLGPLHESFTVVCWDQRGTAGSFAAGRGEGALEPERFVEDTLALSRYLADKYGQSRIYLAGHSWGSIIGVRAVKRDPGLYAAYIGIGQQVNGIENDRIGWEMVRQGALRQGDQDAAELMDRNGPPPYDDGERYFDLLSRLYRYSPRPPDMDRFDSSLMFTAPEHSFLDRVNLIRGLIRGVKVVYPRVARVDFEAEVPSLSVPVYLANGRYDFTCVAGIAERWFESLEAPRKELLWFERSGHESCYTESGRFMAWLTDRILPETYDRWRGIE